MIIKIQFEYITIAYFCIKFMRPKENDEKFVC